MRRLIARLVAAVWATYPPTPPTPPLLCFQHPDRPAEVTLAFYDKNRGGGWTRFGLCHNCRNASVVACLVHAGVIPPDYEIAGIDE